MTIPATCLGYPRIGPQRELKRALESFWHKQSSASDLEKVAADMRRRNWQAMRDAGIDVVPVGDFSLYDHVLDTAVTIGAIPSRYATISDPVTRYFAMARGLQDGNVDVPALEMTKWFDTNYHYIVPELAPDQTFTLDTAKYDAELEEAQNLGVTPRPVILGPVSLLLLSKFSPGSAPDITSPLELLDRLLPVYEQLLIHFQSRGVAWVQLDEPCLVLELDATQRQGYTTALGRLAKLGARPKVLLATYFGSLGDNFPLATQSGLDALHVDLVRAPNQLDGVLAALPKTMALSIGIVDGRNIWRTDLDAAHQAVRAVVKAIGAERVMVAPSCSLLHVPVDLAQEAKLDPELQSWMAFAAQKLGELVALARAGGTDQPSAPTFPEARKALASRASSSRTRNPAVRERVAAVKPDMLRRKIPFAQRSAVQHNRFRLPAFPTTTIGSFPQTSDVRSARAKWRSGELDDASYDKFLREATKQCIAKQEALDLDVLVHGEFERNDMVEYFGEQLDGFAFTSGGWVQSYGSRCVKPPVLFGDVVRPSAMTVDWSTFAQSLTKRPVKGMLTGPVTILQWSFVRNDQPRSETCRQIALALRDEVRDLEAAGITMIQVDEPAIREGLPLRRREWNTYLEWAVDAFRLATTGVEDDTQIHTHMCYSEFGDILQAIADMDADVLSIETSRSNMELLGDFARFEYPNDIGPGVYDIHSPRTPTRNEMVALLRRAVEVLPATRLWVNPDCGLKTRGWPEVEAALANMVAAARTLRELNPAR